MPNYCIFKMKAVGEKQNLDKFKKIIQASYDYSKFPETGNAENTKHFSRIYTADVCNEDDNSLEINGYCAWSVWACMFNGEHTYFDDFKDSRKNVTCIEDVTKELNLTVEINSEESGVSFSEHYIVKNGKIEENEEMDLGYNEKGEVIDTFYGRKFCIT